MLHETAPNPSNNFQLKNQVVELLPTRTSERAQISLSTLETMRTERPSVPASKHGLEIMCGASCETGAQ